MSPFKAILGIFFYTLLYKRVLEWSNDEICLSKQELRIMHRNVLLSMKKPLQKTIQSYRLLISWLSNSNVENCARAHEEEQLIKFGGAYTYHWIRIPDMHLYNFQVYFAAAISQI